MLGKVRNGVSVAILALVGACQAPPPPGQVSWPQAEAAFKQHHLDQAVSIATVLADQGDVRADKLLYGIYMVGGFGVSRDPVRAIAWLTRAAEAGDAESQSNLASAYLGGTAGARVDDAQALRWARAAADQHFALGEAALGFMYEQGRGVPKDPAESIKWTTLAAEQGQAVALSNLASDFEKGFAVPQDYREAVFWFTAALERVGSDVQLRQGIVVGRDRSSSHLSQTDAQQARSEAASWTPAKGALDRVRAMVGVASQGDGDSGRRKVASGSGFVLSKAGYILTNEHVVRSCGSETVSLAGGQKEKAEVVALDKTNDLALLKADRPIGVPAVFRSGSSVHQGDIVVLVGFPLSGLLSTDLNVTTGSVSALTGPQDDTRKLQFTAPTQSGNSGGPLLDQSGTVVGVAEMGLNAVALAVVAGAQSQNANFAIKDSVVETFLDSKGVGYETASGGHERKVSDLSATARGFTVYVECLR